MKTFIEQFSDFMRVEKNYSIHTVRNYTSDIKKFIECENIEAPNDITKYNIRSFLSKLTDDEIEASTRKRKLAAIRSFCSFLYEERYIQENPSLYVSTPKIDDKLPVTMSIQQVSDIIDATKSLRDQALIEFLYATGARVFEASNLKVSDIFPENGGAKLFGKNKKDRMVPTTRKAMQLLEELVESEGLEGENYIFHNPNDKNVPLSTRSLYEIVVKTAKTVGIKTSPHKFRHSCATHLYANKMDIRDIQKLLGHSNINTTTVYTKVDINDLTRNYHQAHPRS